MAWKVKLDEDYGMTSDSRQFILCKIGKKYNKQKGEMEEDWRGIKFVSSEVKVLRQYIAIKKKEANVRNLDEIVEINKEMDRKFEELRERLGV